MKKLQYTFFIVLAIQTAGFAQDTAAIQTDRPDQTECPFITPANYFQFENGFTYEKYDSNSSAIAAPSVLTRYGINNYIELRLITEFLISTENSNTISGISPILIGFKTKLFEEKGIIPTTALIAHLGLPKAASAEYKLNYFYPEFRFSMQHTINQKQSLSYNLGVEWEGVKNTPTYVYTLTSGYSLTEKIGVYTELYGFIPQKEAPDHRADLGMTYLFNHNHQLDISGGIGLSKSSPDYYISLGYSFRFKT